MHLSKACFDIAAKSCGAFYAVKIGRKLEASWEYCNDYKLMLDFVCDPANPGLHFIQLLQ